MKKKITFAKHKKTSRNKMILVTGGAGYIGSHTVVELQEQGYDVIIVDDLSNSQINVIDNIRKITTKKTRFEQFNLADNTRTTKFFAENPIDAIIHFAAHKYVGESVKEPLRYYYNNFVSTLNILQAIEKHDIRHFVFSSSCTVYGQADSLPVTEQSPVKPAECPYGNTKQVIEEILQDICLAVAQLQVISLRYFNPIGAHASALIGELPVGVPQNLVPYITQTAIGKRDCLQVFGNDYNTTDGTCLRDYIHVVDLAKAHVVALDRMLNKKMKKNYEVFNIGTGKPSSVLEIIQSFEKASQMPLPYKFVERRKGDIEKIWADTTCANTVLGWKAEKTLDDMIRSAWNWEKALKENNK
ncbi:MAG: UDP-glucose 4-epimerase GalE [Bacteroidales bacterium]|jgi:UDP-glucose 4-epimerase|nr:UDP-glucose 4-epimerase GalE [Bacteroidales bacterium]